MLEGKRNLFLASVKDFNSFLVWNDRFRGVKDNEYTKKQQ